jgi:uncharacterized protein YqeY
VSLFEKLSSDMIFAMKEKDSVKLSVLRMVKSAVKNKEIEKGEALTDDETMAVFNSFVKKGRESFEQFTKGGREELAAKEKEEIEILQSYLPKQISEDEITAMVKEAISETGAKGPKEFGAVMKSAIARTKGKADGKVVSGMVKKLLEEA